jgi:hypothetical protein
MWFANLAHCWFEAGAKRSLAPARFPRQWFFFSTLIKRFGVLSTVARILRKAENLPT